MSQRPMQSNEKPLIRQQSLNLAMQRGRESNELKVHRMRDNWGDHVNANRPPQSLVAVAIDKDKSSQAALRWTVDNLVEKGQTIFLVHVKHKVPPNQSEEMYSREIFLPYRCYCTRKDIQCKDICLDGPDIAKTIVEFASQNSVEKLVVGAPTKNPFIRRFKTGDVSTSVSKGAPDFCTVYVISKGKTSSIKKATRQAPATSPLRAELQSQAHAKPDLANPSLPSRPSTVGSPLYRSLEDRDSIKSPFSKGASGPNTQSYSDVSSLFETDISFVSSGRPSTDRLFPSLFDDFDQPQRPPRLSNCSDHSFEMMRTPRRSTDTQLIGSEYSGFSQDSGMSSSWSSQTADDVEAEMRRLKLELKQTMDMYNTACREALNAKQKAGELHRWKIEEEQRRQEARMAEETALAIAERERAKCKAALEAAEAAHRIAELEAQKRMNAEMKALKEVEERKKVCESAGHSGIRCRKYAIGEIEIATEYFAASRKIGEGGYGPVFKCYLDHTMVAVKVLRPDAAQGRSQFQQEVEVLSCIRHPNMVLLLGACPEYGCLVYEYLANGSLEDRLFRKGNTPVLPWQLRFRIAAEIATGLLFLHQTKPEPLVHRDLKPANILLDRNFVSKISDVGLARLVPPSVADHVTQYRMTSTAGTFCYIDPEYQQTGMLGVKSDIYSLGIMLLQIITSRPPMGLAHHVQASIENGTFSRMLDPAVPDWPVEEALRFAKIALQCAELRRKDRPDLGSVVLPLLDRLRELADMHPYHNLPLSAAASLNPSPVHSNVSSRQGDFSGPINVPSESEASRSQQSSSSSFVGRPASIA